MLRKSNLIYQEYRALRSLRKNNNITIKPAAKEGMRHLNNNTFYEETNVDYTGEIINRVSLYVSDMLCRGQIFIRQQYTWPLT